MEESLALSHNTQPHPLTQPTLVTLTLSRIFFGGAALLAPKWLSAFCGLPFAAQSSPILLRLFGSRDAAIGLYLWQTRHDVDARRPALVLGLAVDVVDAGAALATFYAGSGGLPVKSAVVVGGGAVVLAVLGAAALGIDHRDRSSGSGGKVVL